MFNSSFEILGHLQPIEDPFLLSLEEEERQPNFQIKAAE
jgi:hypothetical protein